jgi:hypothetical protein
LRGEILGSTRRVLSVSANHKRPFYVFAVVAAICSLVLVTGLRGKANTSPPDEAVATASITVNSAGVTIEKLARAVDARVMNTKYGVLLGGTGRDRGPTSEGGTDSFDPTPSPDDTDGEPNGSGLGDIEGGETPPAPEGSESDVPGDEGDVIETRPQGDEEADDGDESQTNQPNEDPDSQTDDGEETDDDETVGPEDDETGEPTDQGDGYDGDQDQGDGQDPGDGQGDGQSPEADQGRESDLDGQGPDAEQEIVPDLDVDEDEVLDQDLVRD